MIENADIKQQIEVDKIGAEKRKTKQLSVPDSANKPADIKQQIEVDKIGAEKRRTEQLSVPDSANKLPDKFQRLLKKIQLFNEITLDLTDFGLEGDQLKELVDKVNLNPLITILILCHNSLDDNATKYFIHLKYVKTLDISYNNFTMVSISQLLGMKWFNLISNFNNTHSTTIKNNSDTLMFQGPNPKRQLANKMAPTSMMGENSQKKTDRSKNRKN